MLLNVLFFLAIVLLLSAYPLRVYLRQRTARPYLLPYVLATFLFAFASLAVLHLNATGLELVYFESHPGSPDNSSACLDFSAVDANRLTSLPISEGVPCNNLGKFENHFSLSFTPDRSGFAGEPSILVAYQKGNAGRLEKMGLAYVFTVHSRDGRLLGSFDRDLRRFKATGHPEVPPFLSAGETYRLDWEVVDRPTGFQMCLDTSNQPQTSLGCISLCNRNSDCFDRNVYTTDHCRFPGTCHSYCSHDGLFSSITTPPNVAQLLAASSDYPGCAT